MDSQQKGMMTQFKLMGAEVINAKPFLKWAGGKTQLLNELAKRLPETIKSSKHIETYVEPFVGGGAMFFYLKNNFRIERSFLFDINPELVVGYNVMQKDHKKLTKLLKEIEKEYLDKSDEEREKYYYAIRDKFNSQMSDFDYSIYNDSWVERTSYLIFLNKTCFNGLFRQNKKGEFNVPCGSYKNPRICCTDNIVEVNKALRNTEVFCGDFSDSGKYIEKGSFAYFDPPYRPLNTTASFTDYAKDGFDDKDQGRLAKFYKKMDKRGAYLMLSNSDPKNEDPEDNFFDDLYKDYTIERVMASRVINCQGAGRGQIKELIITNY